MLNKQSYYGTKSAGDIETAIKIKNQSNSALYFFATFIIFTSLFSQMKWGRPVLFPIQAGFSLWAVTLLAQPCGDRTSRTSGEC